MSTQERNDRIRELHRNEGWKIRELAEEYEISASRIAQIINEDVAPDTECNYHACDNALVQPSRGRRRKYCCDACRLADKAESQRSLVDSVI